MCSIICLILVLHPTTFYVLLSTDSSALDTLEYRASASTIYDAMYGFTRWTMTPYIVLSTFGSQNVRKVSHFNLRSLIDITTVTEHCVFHKYIVALYDKIVYTRIFAEGLNCLGCMGCLYSSYVSVCRLILLSRTPPNHDTSLIRTHSSITKVFGFERFHCIVSHTHYTQRIEQYV